MSTFFAIMKIKQFLLRHPLLFKTAKILCIPIGWSMFMIYGLLPLKKRLKFVEWLDGFSVNNEFLYSMRMPPADDKPSFGDKIDPDKARSSNSICSAQRFITFHIPPKGFLFLFTYALKHRT